MTEEAGSQKEDIKDNVNRDSPAASKITSGPQDSDPNLTLPGAPPQINGVSARTLESAAIFEKHLLGKFPSRKLYRQDGGKNSELRTKTLHYLENHLQASESLLWTGGMDPLKESSLNQRNPTPRDRTIEIRVGLVILSILLLSKVFSGSFAPVKEMPLLIMVIYLSLCVVSDLKRAKRPKHVAYLLTDRVLHICSCIQVQRENNDAAYFDIFDTEIPLEQIAFANFYKGRPDFDERVEIALYSSTDASTKPSVDSLWLHGFFQDERSSFMHNLRALGIVCNERRRI